MMKTMIDALKDCGLISGNVTDEKYYKPSDCRLPFGSCVNNSDKEQYYDSVKDSLRSINYIREHAEPLTLEYFNELCPVIDKNNKTYKFLCNHIDKCKLISMGSVHLEYNGILGTKKSHHDVEYIRDVEYGLSDMIFYVTFSYQYMRLIPHFDMSTFNVFYQKSYRTDLVEKFGFGEYSSLDEDDALKAINYLLEHSEFIPLKISEYDGVTISHKSYIDPFGRRVDAVQSPALGMNIKKYEKIMKGLESFISNGSKIIDNRLYLILEDRYDKGVYYLRNYDKVINETE